MKHTKDNKKRTKVYCPYCGKSFRDKTDLAIHLCTCKKAEWK